LTDQREDESPIEPGVAAEAPSVVSGEDKLEAASESLIEALIEPAPPGIRRGVAPLWHTGLLIALIVGVSALGANRQQRLISKVPLLYHYAATAVLELIIVGWVFLGLWLGKTRLRSIFGKFPTGLRGIGREIGVAAIFWIFAMCVLGSVAVTWTIAENKIYQVQVNQDEQQARAEPGAPADNPPSGSRGRTPQKKPPAKYRESPQDKQLAVSRLLMTMAPATLVEGIAWGLLCALVGFSEEFIFRGYLMAQGISLLRNVPVGVLFSALVFGAAHGYEGLRGMVVIGVYGALFSGIALLRRNLFPGMIAHAWHDFATGMMLAFIRNTHLLDNLPKH